jgi:Mg2+ and Co2+ transporter CorA
MTDLSTLEALIRAATRAHDRLGGISTERMEGDNISILLCSHFEDLDGEVDENGWTESATDGCDEVLKAIRDHYAPVLEALISRIRELEAQNFALSAGACVQPGPGGLVGDERGNLVCEAMERVRSAEEEVERLTSLCKANNTLARMTREQRDDWCAKATRYLDALESIENEAERENGSWVHLKRAIAVAARTALQETPK